MHAQAGQVRTPAMPMRPAGRGDAAAELGDLRFCNLVAPRRWQTLPAGVRKRFSKRLSGGATAVYAGRIVALRMNLAGRMLSQALRVMGAPLPVCLDTDVPSVVTVTEDVSTGGQIWTRLYAKRSGFPQVIHSAKRFSGPTGLEEYVGYGLTMALRIAVEDETLVFRSAGFSLTLGRLRLLLPGWLTPGALTVRHRETGPGTFEFGLGLQHPLFGELLHQIGHYREERA